MSLHQKQYPEPEAIEVDPAKLHKYVQLLRSAVEKLVPYTELSNPDRRFAESALETTQRLYYPE